MKETVIIKVYRQNITCSDYHDIMLEDFNLKVNELKTFAKSIGKNILFTVCKVLDCADFDCFAEITYNSALSEREKEKYISVIKYFTQDADIAKSELNIYDLPCTIIFTKAQIEII